MASIFDMVWAGGQFWAVGEYGNIMHSADGLDWISSNWQSGFAFYSIAYADSFAVAVGTKGNIYTSSNGAQWTKQVSGTEADLFGVAWNGSAYAASVEKARPAPKAPRLLVRQTKGEGLDVEFHIEMRSDIQLKAYDLSGRILARYAERQVGPGIQTRYIPLNRPQSGVYFLELTSNRGKTIRRAWR